MSSQLIVQWNYILSYSRFFFNSFLHQLHPCQYRYFVLNHVIYYYILLTWWRNIRLFYTASVLTIQNRSRFEPDLPHLLSPKSAIGATPLSFQREYYLQLTLFIFCSLIKTKTPASCQFDSTAEKEHTFTMQWFSSW